MKGLRALFSKFSKRTCVGVFTLAPVEQNSPLVGLNGTCKEALGIETLGGKFTPLIQKGSLVPCQVTEIFSTASDNQSYMEINVFRGEGDKVKEAHPLGVYKIIDIPLMRAGQPQIDVRFEITRTRDIYMSAELENNKEKMKIEKYL